jgi:hypothetical protein
LPKEDWMLEFSPSKTPPLKVIVLKQLTEPQQDCQPELMQAILSRI